MVTIFPYAIGLSVFGVVSLLLYSFSSDVSTVIARYSAAFQVDLIKADLQMKPEEYMLGVVGVGALLWLVSIFVMHGGLLLSIALLPLCEAVSVILATMYLRFRGKRRIAKLVDQLEMVLRMIASAMRVGLGFRQAIILVTEEVSDPARREFMRVMGRSNIGISIVDALDEMARNCPAGELQMFARVVRVQQSTGGDLAKVLEKLATTIRDRRRIIRKIGALTAQGRFGAFIIGALPVVVGGFIVFTQKEMGDVLLHTKPGWGVLAAVGVLEGLAAYVLSRILILDG
ncbi:MAG: type II secretion system F family protein [Candidatus Eremiobacteraeota bacterium]|nr:type II secretion system F family protein [Candidatus Eremiobacteraeota bacterium]